MSQINEEKVKATYGKLDADAEKFGYHLSPDKEFVMELVRGLLANEETYGYWACPCRLADGNKQDDLDIICPCDYRDPDLNEYGACYCALYVTREVKQGEKELESIPDRRPSYSERKAMREAGKQGDKGSESPSELPYPVWRCKVCGYLAAREEPPNTCPICKVGKERFERFM